MTMNDGPSTSAGHGRQGALAALIEVAAGGEMRRRFGAAAAAFHEEDYEALIALAWRHQFDDDRSKFKRELNSMQEQISQRILGRLELEK